MKILKSGFAGGIILVLIFLSDLIISEKFLREIESFPALVVSRFNILHLDNELLDLTIGILAVFVVGFIIGALIGKLFKELSRVSKDYKNQ